MANSIYSLKRELHKKLHKIPAWINSTDQLHYIIWQAIIECNSIIFKMIKARVLDDKEINDVISEFHECIDIIINNTESEIHILLSIYYIELLEEIIIMCEEEEQYEVCSNVKRFTDIYFNNNYSGGK